MGAGIIVQGPINVMGSNVAGLWTNFQPPEQQADKVAKAPMPRHKFVNTTLSRFNVYVLGLCEHHAQTPKMEKIHRTISGSATHWQRVFEQVGGCGKFDIDTEKRGGHCVP